MDLIKLSRNENTESMEGLTPEQRQWWETRRSPECLDFFQGRKTRPYVSLVACRRPGFEDVSFSADTLIVPPTSVNVIVVSSFTTERSQSSSRLRIPAAVCGVTLNGITPTIGASSGKEVRYMFRKVNLDESPLQDAQTFEELKGPAPLVCPEDGLLQIRRVARNVDLVMGYIDRIKSPKVIYRIPVELFVEGNSLHAFYADAKHLPDWELRDLGERQKGSHIVDLPEGMSIGVAARTENGSPKFYMQPSTRLSASREGELIGILNSVNDDQFALALKKSQYIDPSTWAWRALFELNNENLEELMRQLISKTPVPVANDFLRALGPQGQLSIISHGGTIQSIETITDDVKRVKYEDGREQFVPSSSVLAFRVGPAMTPIEPGMTLEAGTPMGSYCSRIDFRSIQEVAGILKSNMTSVFREFMHSTVIRPGAEWQGNGVLVPASYITQHHLSLVEGGVEYPQWYVDFRPSQEYLDTAGYITPPPFKQQMTKDRPVSLGDFMVYAHTFPSGREFRPKRSNNRPPRYAATAEVDDI